MIKFFKLIRQELLSQNKVSKYLLYAVGEIVLVVIGILIALSINNSNELQKQNDQIVKYAKLLVNDIEKDIAMMDTIHNTAIKVSIRLDSLANYVRNSKIENISNLNVICLTWIRLYRPYAWNRSTLQEIKSSGSLRLINNEDILNRIVEYESKTRHMDEDYYADKEQSESASQLLNMVVNYNYPNMKKLGTMLRITTNSGEIRDTFNDPVYKEAQEYEISFLEKDKDLLDNAVNQFIRLNYLINIRTAIELPDLRKDGQKLIDLLKEEYQL